MNRSEVRDKIRHHKVLSGASPFSYSNEDIRYITNTIIKEIIAYTSKNKIPPFILPWDRKMKIKDFKLKKPQRKNRVDTFTEEVVDQMSEIHPLDIKHNKTQAHYVSYQSWKKADYISVPYQIVFSQKKFYYKTLFHEFAHALSDPFRLQLTHGRGKYAEHREELVAETVALVLCFVLGLNCWESCLGYIEDWNGMDPTTSILSKKENLEMYKHNVNKIVENIFCYSAT